MMRWRLAAAIALVLAGASAGAADGAPLTVLAPSSGARLLSETRVPILAHGTVVVSFHGDLASGCAEHGLCGLNGTFALRPRAGGVMIDDVSVKGRRAAVVALALSSQGRTTARWPSPVPPCADTVASEGGAVGLGIERGTVRLGLTSTLSVGLAAFAGRCGGPLVADLAGLLPAQHVALADLRRGRHRIDLSATGRFASHGLAGSVSSSVTLDLGAPERDEPSTATGSGTRVRRLRILSVSYRVAALSGAATTTLQGRADPDSCTLLAACGAAGILTVRPAPGPGSLTLSVAASTRRPVRDLRTALGLASGGRTAGLEVLGAGQVSQHGTVVQSLTAPGRPACRDERQLGPSQLALGGSADAALRVAYGPPVTTGAALRTRCPGPTTSDMVAGRGLAAGVIQRGGLSARVLRIRLDRGVRFAGDGYAGATSADIVITLRRVRVSTRIFAERESVGL